MKVGKTDTVAILNMKLHANMMLLIQLALSYAQTAKPGHRGRRELFSSRVIKF